MKTRNAFHKPCLMISKEIAIQGMFSAKKRKKSYEGSSDRRLLKLDAVPKKLQHPYFDHAHGWLFGTNRTLADKSIVSFEARSSSIGEIERKGGFSRRKRAGNKEHSGNFWEHGKTLCHSTMGGHTNRATLGYDSIIKMVCMNRENSGN